MVIVMTTIIKLTLSELKKLLPNGCINIKCTDCPFVKDPDICQQMVYLHYLNK